MANPLLDNNYSAGEWLNLFREFKRTGVTFSAILRGETRIQYGDPLGEHVTERTSDGPWQIIYGNTRVGGVFTFLSTDYPQGGEHLHAMLTIAGHQVSDVTALYLNTTKVTFANDPPLTTQWANGTWLNYVFMSKETLGGHSAANPSLITQATTYFPGKWTSAHKQLGRASVYLILKYNGTLFPTGIPKIRFQVLGNNQIYDPRGPSTGYSNNAALCIANYLTNTEFGLGVDYATEIDETNLIAAANICDEDVSLSGGGTENRYEMNGSFYVDQSPSDVLQQMATSIAGDIVFSEGVWRIYPGKYAASVVTLTESDLLSSITVQTKPSRRENFNAISGRYVSSKNNYKVSDFPTVKNSFYESQDGGKRIYADITLPFTTSSAAAQRIAKLELERRRQPIMVSATWGLKAYKALVKENVALTLSRFGWTAKEFEVLESSLVSSKEFGGAPAIGIEMLLKETASAVFDWNSGNETTVDVAPNTNLPSPTNVAIPTNLVLSSGTNDLFIREDGTIFSRIKVSWTAPVDGYVTAGGGYIEVQFKQSSNVDWLPWQLVPGDLTSTYILDVQDGVNYDVRIRSVNGFGNTSDWLQSLFHLVIGKTAPPSDVQNFDVSVTDYGISITWSAIPDKDFSRYEIRQGATWATALLVAQANGTSLNLDIQTAGSYTFLIKAFDTSGNESTTAASDSVTIAVPSAPVVSFSIQGPDVVLSWTVPASQFAIDQYEVSYGAAAGDNAVANSRSNSFRFKAEYGGNRKYWIQARDVAGNLGTGGSVDVNIDSPSQVLSLTADVIDNNVFLRWLPPSTGTLPIELYTVYVGDVFASSTLIGTAFATFHTRFELVADIYTYWIVPKDSAGNEGTEHSVQASVSQPPDFVLRNNAELEPIYAETRTNVLIGYDDVLHNAVFASANSEYLQATDSSDLSIGNDQAFTLCCRFKASTLNGTNRGIVSKLNADTSTGGEYELSIDTSNKLQFSVVGGTTRTNAVSASALTVDTWYIAFAYYNHASQQIKLIIDDGTPVTQAHTANINDSTANFEIGRKSGATNYFNGQVSFVALWKRLLTSVEISKLSDITDALSYAAFDAGLLENLVSAWDLAEVSTGAGPVTREDLYGISDLTDFNTVTSTALVRGNEKTIELPLNDVLVPMIPNVSYEYHFTSNSFTTIQSQIDAGYPYFLQPSNVAASVIERTFDYGVVLANSLINVTYSSDAIAGSVANVVAIATSEDGITFGAYTEADSIFATNFRAVKVKITSTGSGLTSFAQLTDFRVRLDVKKGRDSGAGTAYATDSAGTTVTFERDFVDIISITPTPSGIQRVAEFFDVSNTYLSIADNASLSMGDIDMTIAGWFYFYGKSRDMALMGKWTTTGNQREYLLHYVTASDVLRFSVSNDGSASTVVSASNLGTLPLNTWLYIVAWHDSINNEIGIQVNGITANTAAHTTGIFNGSSSFEIGAREAGTENFDGRAANAAVWKRALTSTERKNFLAYGYKVTLAELSAAEITNLEAFWYLDETAGTTRDDAQGSNNLADNNTVGGFVISKYAYYDFLDVPNPADFKVLVFDSQNIRLTSDFSWTAEGFTSPILDAQVAGADSSEDKRRYIVGVLPKPDGSVSAANRRHIAGIYPF